MVKVSSAPDRRPEIISLAEVFEARVVDVGPAAVTFACVGPPDRLEALEELLSPYGIRELVRPAGSGSIVTANSTNESE